MELFVSAYQEGDPEGPEVEPGENYVFLEQKLIRRSIGERSPINLTSSGVDSADTIQTQLLGSTASDDYHPLKSTNNYYELHSKKGFSFEHQSGHCFSFTYTKLILVFIYHYLYPLSLPLAIYMEGMTVVRAMSMWGLNYKSFRYGYAPNFAFWCIIIVSVIMFVKYDDASGLLKTYLMTLVVNCMVAKAINDYVKGLKYATFTKSDWIELKCWEENKSMLDNSSDNVSDDFNTAGEIIPSRHRRQGPFEGRILFNWPVPSNQCVAREVKLSAFRNAIPTCCSQFYFEYGTGADSIRQTEALRRLVYRPDIADQLNQLCPDAQYEDGKMSALQVVYSAFLQSTNDLKNNYPHPFYTGLVFGVIVALLPVSYDIVIGDLSKLWGENPHQSDGDSGYPPYVLVTCIAWLLFFPLTHGACLGYVTLAWHDYVRRAHVMKFFTSLIVPRRGHVSRSARTSSAALDTEHPDSLLRIPEVELLDPALKITEHNLMTWLQARVLAKSIGSSFLTRLQMVCALALLFNLSFTVYFLLSVFDVGSIFHFNRSTVALATMVLVDNSFLWFILCNVVIAGNRANQMNEYASIGLHRIKMHKHLLPHHHSLHGVDSKNPCDPTQETCTTSTFQQQSYDSPVEELLALQKLRMKGEAFEDTLSNVLGWLEMERNQFPLRVFGFKASNRLFKGLATVALSTIGAVINSGYR